MSEKTVTIDASGEKIHLTERKLKHPKSGKMSIYLSFSNGMDVAGAYITEKTKKEIIKFLSPRKTKNNNDGQGDNQTGDQNPENNNNSTEDNTNGNN